jgi:hypothetical protein
MTPYMVVEWCFAGMMVLLILAMFCALVGLVVYSIKDFFKK